MAKDASFVYFYDINRMKKKSIFKELKNAVSKLPGWVSSHVPIVHKKKPESSFTETIPSHSTESFMSMDAAKFKELINNIFKQRGYTITEQNDEVDLVLIENNETTFVQFKHWKEAEVDITAIIQLFATMKENNARHGVVITSGVFTSEALDFALGKALLLINGHDLSQMIDALNNSDEDESLSDNVTELAEPEMPELEPLCPICSQKMIKRTARKGKNAGNTFWGCSQFPNCRGVVQNTK